MYKSTIKSFSNFLTLSCLALAIVKATDYNEDDIASTID
jgi:hypothetical protein